MVRAAEDFDAFYEARRAAEGEPAPEGSVVVLTFDGKGVVLHREDLREATRKAAERRRRHREPLSRFHPPQATPSQKDSMKTESSLLPGTLELLILKAISVGPATHGYGVLLRIQQISGDAFNVRQGSHYGYRANIVAYAIAKMARDARESGRAVDFQDIWHRQGLPPAMAPALIVVAQSVHEVLVSPPLGISNVTEWAKKQACWNRVSELDIAWPQPFLDGLITIDDRRDEVRSARREQRQLNSVQAQIAVVTAGPAFWAAALAWGTERRLLTPTEVGVLGAAANPAGRTLTDRQASRAVEALTKLQSEGFSGELTSSA